MATLGPGWPTLTIFEESFQEGRETTPAFLSLLQQLVGTAFPNLSDEAQR